MSSDDPCLCSWYKVLACNHHSVVSLWRRLRTHDVGLVRDGHRCFASIQRGLQYHVCGHAVSTCPFSPLKVSHRRYWRKLEHSLSKTRRIHTFERRLSYRFCMCENDGRSGGLDADLDARADERSARIRDTAVMRRRRRKTGRMRGRCRHRHRRQRHRYQHCYLDWQLRRYATAF